MGRLQIEERLQNATSREIELLDWDTYFAYDTETFGENSPLGRKNKSEVVLKKYLREAIIRINKEYEIPNKVLDRVIEKFTEEDRLKSLININKEKYEYIKNGFTEKWTDKNGKEIEAKLKLIDFDEKSTDEEKNNYFLFVRELWVSTSIHTRRCDGVGFINGIPLVFVELKGSTYIQGKLIRLNDGNFIVQLYDWKDDCYKTVSNEELDRIKMYCVVD